jgi:Flp pilus assembly protein TadB
MKAGYILVGVLVVVLVALAVIYAQATGQLQQLSEELKKAKEDNEALKTQISTNTTRRNRHKQGERFEGIHSTRHWNRPCNRYCCGLLCQCGHPSICL